MKHHPGRVARAVLTVVALLLAFPLALRADEGFWLFNRIPKAAIKQAYGVDLTDAWLERVQQASVRFPSGSGSFVSADGLVLTNHHVALDIVQELSTADRDYVTTRLRRPRSRTGAEGAGPRARRAADHRRRDGAGERGDQAGHVAGRDPGGAPRGDRRNRRRGGGEDRAAERGGDALSGRAVPPVSLQEVHRRPARVRARVRHRVLRRRSRQLHVPALLPRHGALPRLRERQAAAGEAFPAVVGRRHQGRRGRVHLGSPRRDAAAEHGGAPGVPARSLAAAQHRAVQRAFATRSRPTASRAASRSAQAKDLVLRPRELAEVVEGAARRAEGPRAS